MNQRARRYSVRKRAESWYENKEECRKDFRVANI